MGRSCLKQPANKTDYVLFWPSCLPISIWFPLLRELFKKVRKKGKDLLKDSSNITKQRIEECSTFAVKRQWVKEWHHLLVTQTLNHKTPLLRLKVKILLPRRRIIKASKDTKLFITFFKTRFICQINYACT